LSPDVDFSQQGAKSQINYLKAFRRYRDMLIAQGNSQSSTYRILMDTYNRSIFGDKRVQSTKATCGGDGESEDEMEEYCRRLEVSHQPLPSDIDVIEDALSEEAAPVLPPSPLPTVEEEPTIAEPKKRPVPRKKAAPSAASSEDPPTLESSEATTHSAGKQVIRRTKNKTTIEQKTTSVENQTTTRTLRKRG
jgi:hypothetical protein